MKNNLSDDSVVVVSKEQISTDLVGEVAILHLKRGVYYGLNEVGARVWNLIQTPRTVMEVQDHLIAEYGVKPERCKGDLHVLLHQLMAEQLVQIKEKKTAFV